MEKWKHLKKTQIRPINCKQANTEEKKTLKAMEEEERQFDHENS